MSLAANQTTRLRSLPLPLRLYRAASYLAPPFVDHLLRKRLARGKEDPARIGERTGNSARARPDGPLVWVHAASVGEAMSVLPLVNRIAAALPVTLTTGTVTSARLVETRLAPKAFHQFVPVDTHQATQRFHGHWRPDLAILCESEIWPNLMLGAQERGIPLGIVNGRMSERSFRSWQRLPRSAGALLGTLAFCLAQSEGDAARFLALGAPARFVGNLKFDAPSLSVAAAALQSLRAAMQGRPVLLAASTHPGEEALVLAAARALRGEFPDLLTILVPRHPERGEEVARIAAGQGDKARRRDQGTLPAQGEPVYIADTLGELGLFYSVADIAFIGGSLVEHGGHNPIEAIRFDAPIVSGAHVANFASIFAELAADGAAVMVSAPEELVRTCHALLRDAEARRLLAAKARQMIARHEGALGRVLDVIEPFLARIGKAVP